MSDNNGSNSRNVWAADMTNWGSVVALIVVLFGLWKDFRLVLVGFGFLGLITLVKFADIKRFKDSLATLDEIPALGLTSGSVRALLAFGLLIGLGYCVYHGLVGGEPSKKFNEIFTAVSSLMSAVVGFYFGAKTAQASEKGAATSAFKVSDIDPDIGDAGKPAKITNLSGVGFLPGLSVSLRKGDKTIEGEDVKVIQQTKATCTFDIPPASERGKWHVVVINPDGATSSLRERFTIK